MNLLDKTKKGKQAFVPPFLNLRPGEIDSTVGFMWFRSAQPKRVRSYAITPRKK